MRTNNKHPYWHNAPIRLTEEQAHNPMPVVTNFFEDYHLHDVREILWYWLVIVLGNCNDAGERKNAIAFYEDIETVIEAIYIIQKNKEP